MTVGSAASAPNARKVRAICQPRSDTLDLPPYLSAEETARLQCQAEYDQHERDGHLVLSAEITAGEVLGHADDEGADHRSRQRIQAAKHGAHVALHEDAVHHLGAHVDEGREEYAADGGEDTAHRPGQEDDG